MEPIHSLTEAGLKFYSTQCKP